MLKVDLYTDRADVFEFSQMQPSINFLPQWWKTLPASSEYPTEGMLHANNTMKNCPGFVDLYKNSYTIPLWSDGKIITEEHDRYDYMFADNETNVSSHEAREYAQFMPEDKWQHIKIRSPWLIFANKPTKWAWVPPTWNYLPNVRFLSAMEEYHYQHSIVFQMFIKTHSETILPFQTPMVHMIPLTEEKVKIKHHLISKEEFQQKQAPHFPHTFARWYYNHKRLKKNGCK